MLVSIVVAGTFPSRLLMTQFAYRALGKKCEFNSKQFFARPTFKKIKKKLVAGAAMAAKLFSIISARLAF
jgi:hypothetical protein